MPPGGRRRTCRRFLDDRTSRPASEPQTAAAGVPPHLPPHLRSRPPAVDVNRHCDGDTELAIKRHRGGYVRPKGHWAAGRRTRISECRIRVDPTSPSARSVGCDLPVTPAAGANKMPSGGRKTCLRFLDARTSRPASERGPATCRTCGLCRVARGLIGRRRGRSSSAAGSAKVKAGRCDPGDVADPDGEARQRRNRQHPALGRRAGS